MIAFRFGGYPLVQEQVAFADVILLNKSSSSIIFRTKISALNLCRNSTIFKAEDRTYENFKN